MPLDARRSVDQGLHHLALRLNPIIAARLASSLGGLPWPTVLIEIDNMRGKPPKVYAATDLQSQLRVITERLGNLGFPFDDHTRLVGALGNELRIMRNRWAHQDELTTLDAWRAHDSVVRLLEHFGDHEGAASASNMRDEAFLVLAEEKGITAPPATAATPAAEPPTPPSSGSVQVEVIRPDPTVLSRSDATGTPSIGEDRFEFEPWTVVPVGDVSVLDDLPKKAAKEKVRAVATEIAEFEGPIHINRLAQLTAGSFGVQRLWLAREKKLTYQIRQTGLLIDDDKFVWPTGIDPQAWDEFRPNDSTVDRPFTQISPIEIANAMRLLTNTGPNMNPTELDAATLQTFGRQRKTKQLAAHLERSRTFV